MKKFVVFAVLILLTACSPQHSFTSEEIIAHLKTDIRVKNPYIERVFTGTDGGEHVLFREAVYEAPPDSGEFNEDFWGLCALDSGEIYYLYSNLELLKIVDENYFIFVDRVPNYKTNSFPEKLHIFKTAGSDDFFRAREEYYFPVTREFRFGFNNHMELVSCGFSESYMTVTLEPFMLVGGEAAPPAMETHYSPKEKLFTVRFINTICKVEEESFKGSLIYENADISQEGGDTVVKFSGVTSNIEYLIDTKAIFVNDISRHYEPPIFEIQLDLKAF